MGFLNWLRGDTTRSAEDHAISSGYSFFFGATSSGRPVTERSAMQMTAVYSCVRILTEAIAGLPLHVCQQSSDGAKVKALDHPLYRLLHDEPNPEMTSFVFRETLMTHLLLWGNAFAQVIRNGRDEVIGLYPLMLNRMTVGRDEAGRLFRRHSGCLVTFLDTTVACSGASKGMGARQMVRLGVERLAEVQPRRRAQSTRGE